MLYLILLCSAIAYLLGSINTSIITSKLMGKGDIRNSGSGNAGATNTLRVLGKGAAVMVLIGDILKGVLAVLFAKWAFAYFNVPGDKMLPQYFAALFVVLGHIYPLFFGFKGGKGVLTGATTVFMLSWEIGVILLLIFIAIFVTTRFVSLGSCISSILYPVLVALFYQDVYFIAVSLIIGFLSIFKHRSNIVRLYNGTESKTYFKR